MAESAHGVPGFTATYRALMGTDAPPLASDQLKKFWPKPVSELCELTDEEPLSEAAKERHRLYCFLLAAIIHRYWNGNKRGRRGKYPWNDSATPEDPPELSGDYLGHNIAALAVDAYGRVLDFDFNHNELFNSSAEHAEARLVRRLYSLAQVSEAWSGAAAVDALGEPSNRTRYTNLAHVTIYTSLESCAQCAGAMALAQVKEVVYMQTDPGMYFIGRILRNLTTEKLRAPRPIAGGEIDLRLFGELDDDFTTFVKGVETKPFFEPPSGEPDRSPSVTSFLCTASARRIFAGGRARFRSLCRGEEPLDFPDFRPRPGALENHELLEELGAFEHYAIEIGKRATPHNL